MGLNDRVIYCDIMTLILMHTSKSNVCVCVCIEGEKRLGSNLILSMCRLL